MVVKSWQVPFVNGNQVHYVDDWRPNVVLKDPYEFTDELRFVSYHKGRSRVTVELQSVSSNTSYECTLDKFFQMLRLGHIYQIGSYQKDFYIRGKFGFKKLGSTISLYLIPEN